MGTEPITVAYLILPWIFLASVGWRKVHASFLFYAIVPAVLWRSRELRKIWNGPHLIGLTLMLLILPRGHSVPVR
jgi:hypothetical protein